MWCDINLAFFQTCISVFANDVGRILTLRDITILIV